MTVNGESNGAQTNGQSAAPVLEKGSWTVGLVNSRHKYLSAETFGFKINANGKTMKKKQVRLVSCRAAFSSNTIIMTQVWILEPYGDGDSICLRSHLHKYLAVEQFGNVTCENEEKDESAKFEISVCDDFSGRWAFR